MYIKKKKGKRKIKKGEEKGNGKLRVKQSKLGKN